MLFRVENKIILSFCLDVVVVLSGLWLFVGGVREVFYGELVWEVLFLGSLIGIDFIIIWGSSAWVLLGSLARVLLGRWFLGIF